MNILPKKRWHVRTKENIARVRRDEAKAAEEEKELKRRIQLAEQEARINILKKRAKSSLDSDEVQTASEVQNVSEEVQDASENKHVNFFSEIEEAGGYLGGKNLEHEEEEKARKEKFEKNIGLLTYLGQSSLEAKNEMPWYLKSSIFQKGSSDGKDEIVSQKHKERIDPLNDMKKYLALKEKKYETQKSTKSNSKSSHTSHQKELLVEKYTSPLEKMRAQRLQREQKERQRTQEFLENLRKNSERKETVIVDDRLRKYNSQFNPHIAKHK